MDDYCFQRDLAARFDTGENIVLQAPTGAGKTRAALSPGLHGFERKDPAHHPSRVLYGVPMRVLARSFFQEITHTAHEKGWEKEWYPRVQMGEQADDPLLEGRLIFATVDQMLASFLHMPYGIPRRLSNINAAALVGSYLIFDEFHLYPGHEMMLTVLAMLKMLDGLSRFTLMSATFSKRFLEAIARELGASVIADEPGTPSGDSLFADVPSLQSQQRTWFASDGALDADAIRPKLGYRTIALCNTVERAQALYASCREWSDVECKLLHSRFYREDRRRIEDWALANYGKPDRLTSQQEPLRTDKRCLLIATQVIEVGLDISSDVMLTECAPAASLIQRAGRCARREHEQGHIYVYQPYDSDGQVTYAPYGGGKKQDDEDAGLEGVCRKTWEALTSSMFNRKVLRFAEEQGLINAAHGDYDDRFIAGLSANLERRIAEITACIRDQHPGLLGDLIRKQMSVPLYIHSHLKSEALTERPRQLESLSVSRGQVARAFGAAEAVNPDAEFWMAGCTGAALPTPDDDGMTQPTFEWRALRSGSEVFEGGFAWFVAHPDAISYDEHYGLRLTPGQQPARESPHVPRSRRQSEPFIADRYHEHITGLWLAYTRPFEISHSAPMQEGYRFEQGDKLYMPLQHEIAYGLRCLCQRAGKDPAVAEYLIRLMLALHDVGKLNRRWQAWAQGWQQERLKHGLEVKVMPDDMPLAHTDYDRSIDGEAALYKSFRLSRGTHAVESAEACLPVLWEACGKDEFFFDVVISAIMHHHTPTASECGPFEMVADGQMPLIRALAACGLEASAESIAAQIRPEFKQSGKRVAAAPHNIQPSPRDYDRVLMYALFVRVLRLADQRSGDYWRRYGDR